MIVSVGGSPEPIVFTLREARPDFVCFLTSQRSIDEIGAIKRALDFSMPDEKVVTESPDDLVECYRCAVSCLERVRRRGVSLDDTVIDYTGGTKPMSAALAMAAASYGVRFSYVGGALRTKGGAGTVQSGSEIRRVDQNPWHLFAVEEKRQIALYFNCHQFEAAAAALEALLARLVEPDRSLLEAMVEVTRGYAAWDRFDHRAALRLLPPARRKLEERVRAATAVEYGEILERMEENVRVLGGFMTTPVNVAGDLVANAERRIDEGKFDDAVARLYRAIELVGQRAFEVSLGVDTGRVPLERLPPQLREEFSRKYSEDDGVSAKIPLLATYRVLAEIGNPVGARFFAVEDEMRRILDGRNSSILGHGLRSIARSTAESFLALVKGFLPADVPQPRFPRLPW